MQVAPPSSRATQLLLGTILFCATTAMVLWQNAHVAILWDLSYLLDSANRIALGQIPYRDFPFAHAPLTFLLQALSIRIAGRVYWHVIAYAALTGGTATLLTWRILLRLLQQTPPTAFLLALALIFLGITSIYPHPIYDNDCILAILFAIFCLQRAKPTTPIRNVLTGAALIPPLFFKQNIGLLFLATCLAVLITLAIRNKLERRPARTEALIATGAAITLALALLAIHCTAGLHNYLYWTITFAAHQRLPSFGSMLSVYHQQQLLWSLPAAAAGLYLLHRSAPTKRRWQQLIALLVLAAPFLYTLASLLWLDDPSDRADQLLTLWPLILLLSAALLLYDIARRHITLTTLLPLILLAAIHGTFLSQQLWGSSYAIWPLLLLLTACLLNRLPSLTLPIAAIITLTLLVNGSLYALSHERLGYSQLAGAPARSTLPALRGLTTPGPWLPAFDELVRDTTLRIPPSDTILLFPGQDPFYYATGRTPRFPVLLFDIATNPYTPAQLAQAAARQNVRWLIVNRTLQLTEPPLTNYNAYLDALTPLFTLDHQLTNYDIYRRR